MNKELIEKTNKALEYLNEYSNYLAKMGDKCHKLGYEYEHLIPKKYDIEDKIKDYEYIKEVLQRLNEEKIDLSKKYFITNNIYLCIMQWGTNFSFSFYIENDSWLYENYINSHSGINEWIFNLIKQEYDLFSGNSSYSYAFGTTTMNDYLRIIENVNTEKYGYKRPYSAEQVVTAIKSLIEYFTDENNRTRNIIIDEINHKLENMKKLMIKIERHNK